MYTLAYSYTHAFTRAVKYINKHAARCSRLHAHINTAFEIVCVLRNNARDLLALTILGLFLVIIVMAYDLIIYFNGATTHQQQLPPKHQFDLRPILANHLISALADYGFRWRRK